MRSYCPNNFQDIWDRLPQILGVRWPRPRPFWGKLLARPLGFSKRKLCTKLEVSSSCDFEDMFNLCCSQRVTWLRPRPYLGKLFEHPLGFPQMKLYTKFEVPSSSSFEDTFDCMPKILGVTWRRPCRHAPLGKIILAPTRLSPDEARPRPFWGKLLERPLGFPQMKLYTKFEVPSSSSFEDMFDCMPNNFRGHVT